MRLPNRALVLGVELNTNEPALLGQLYDLDEVTWDYFESERALDAVHRKVAVLFPEHEVEAFTEHFWGLIQFWRKTERDRLDARTA